MEGSDHRRQASDLTCHSLHEPNQTESSASGAQPFERSELTDRGLGGKWWLLIIIHHFPPAT